MTLRDSLIPVVDNARQMVADSGLRPYTVTIRTRVWSGGKIGTGEATDSDLVISPAPKVERFPVRLIASSGGIYQEGDLQITKISATYSEEDLWLSATAGTEVLWILNEETFRAVTQPERKNFQWKTVVRRLNRPRGT